MFAIVRLRLLAHPKVKTTKWHWLMYRACLSLSAIFFCGLTTGCRSEFGNKEISSHSISLSQIYTSCTNDMVKNICTVMEQGPTLNNMAVSGDVTYIAGVGAVNVIEYQSILQSGEAMCDVILESCANDWNSSQCLTARKIYLK